jgi:hypothetical protein
MQFDDVFNTDNSFIPQCFVTSEPPKRHGDVHHAITMDLSIMRDFKKNDCQRPIVGLVQDTHK